MWSVETIAATVDSTAPAESMPRSSRSFRRSLLSARRRLLAVLFASRSSVRCSTDACTRSCALVAPPQRPAMYLQPELASRSAYHPQAQTHGEEDEAPCEEEEQIKTRERQRALATTASDCALHSSAFTKP